VVQAEVGIEKLRSEVDTLIVIPNDRLLSISDRHVSVLDAFKAADQVLLSGVQGITDLITTPGLINLDFADVKSVMSGAGSALMGTGSSRGDDRAVAAAEMAISSPLLEASIDGAHGVLLSIQGGSDLGLFEINEAAQLVSNSAAVDANIIFGAVIDDALGDEVRVTVIAAGLDQGRSSQSAAAGAAEPTFGGGSSQVISGGFTPPAEPAPVPAPAPRPAPVVSEPSPAGHEAVPPAVPDTGAMASAGSIFSAPVPEDAARPGPAEDVARVREVPSPAPPRPERAAVAADAPDADSSSYRPVHAESAPKTFDVAATRRRPVVFEEDDDLDVPDFLK
jgi:cell division protein FtsZ